MRRPQSKSGTKKRKKVSQSAKHWHRIGQEREFANILLTRVSRKPPAYKCETTDDDGQMIVVGLEKAPKGIKGWLLHTPHANEPQFFRTRRDALMHVSSLQVTKVEKEDEQADDVVR